MKNLIVFALLFSAQIAIGQKYFSKTGKISFYSEAAMEKIEGHNTSASTVIDASTGAVEWGVLIQGFKFEKSLMQDHFNENYMESSIYPKAKFKGKIDNLAIVNFSKDGQYNVNVTGALEIHGVTKTVTTPAVITIKGGAVSARSKFAVAIADYKIEVPKLVADNIAEKVNIEIIADYQLMNPVP
ncbi:MAG: YceI family protein [Saprospiraceae bacterium]|nr:YceI family protein [Candidatus Opimibacter skivensis]